MDMNEILELIDLKQEGGYWDFKRQWYKHDEKSDLLHDILCMSNNLVDRDAYIIIGVDEEDDYKIKDVKDDKNRKNTQKIVDFLKDKKFAGDIRPTVKVESLDLHEGTIDIIIIKNDIYTPCYLKERFQQVQANYIYARIQDTNTPIDRSADIDKVEWLWKKRFGLLKTPLEKVEIYLKQPNNWSNGPYGETQKYYKLFPEYTLTYEDADDNRDGYEFYLFSQYDSTPHWRDIKIRYHQTLLMDIGGVSLDGGRYFTPCPLTDGISIDKYHDWDIVFKYMEIDSFIYKLNEFFYIQEWTDDARISRDRFFSVVILFKNKNERLNFKEYVIKNWTKRDEYKNAIHVPHIPNIEGYREGAFVEKYENALILNKMLCEFRSKIN